LSSVVNKNGKIDEVEIIEALSKTAKNVNMMDEIKKEWKKRKNSYSESEAKLILEEAKKDLGK
jgi:hypothetical protein